MTDHIRTVSQPTSMYRPLQDHTITHEPAKAGRELFTCVCLQCKHASLHECVQWQRQGVLTHNIRTYIHMQPAQCTCTNPHPLPYTVDCTGVHSMQYVSGLSLQPTCIWCTHALSLSILPVHRHTSTGNEVHAAILKGTCVCYRRWLSPALHTCTLHMCIRTSQHNTCCYKYSMHTHM